MNYYAPEYVQILSKPVMIMGADVSHPAPESRRLKPSIVAVTGSVEPKATQYETQVALSTGLALYSIDLHR